MIDHLTTQEDMYFEVEIDNESQIDCIERVCHEVAPRLKQSYDQIDCSDSLAEDI